LFTYLALKRDRPTGITGTIHNVQVRGKRGNIVQVYPGVEYDFFPASMNVKLGDYVHFQWTGSNNNPQNNDGQGTAGTDRSNIVELRPAVYNECVDINGQPSTTACATNPTTYGQFGRAYPVRNIDTNPFLGFSHDKLRHLAILDVNGQVSLVVFEVCAFFVFCNTWLVEIIRVDGLT
jgi:hypothetical protein